MQSAIASLTSSIVEAPYSSYVTVSFGHFSCITLGSVVGDGESKENRPAVRHLRNIDLLHLQCFILAAESGSIRGAGRTLDLTPSSVSRRINQLEGELGQRLLDRTRKGVATTVAGSLYLRRSSLALRELTRRID